LAIRGQINVYSIKATALHAFVVAFVVGATKGTQPTARISGQP
jgi:hypothetical protein